MSLPDVLTRNVLIPDVLRVMNALGPAPLPPSQMDNVRAMLSSYLPGLRQGDLFDREPPRNGDRLVKLAMAMARGDDVRHESGLPLAIKVAMVVGHVRGGRWDRVGSEEARAVAKILRVHIPDGAYDGPRVSHQPDDAPVEFIFPWRPGNLRTHGWLGISTAHADLTNIAPIDAPVTCSLWTPEGRLELRRLGPDWLRPVLSPGSWKPATVAEFRDAARSGCPWRDNPFLPNRHRGLPTFNLLDQSRLQSLTAGNVRRMSEARETCLVTAGQLRVVDGIVHRSTVAPLAGIGTIYVAGMAMAGPAWSMDDVASTGDVGTFGEDSVATWFDGRHMPDRNGATDPDGSFVALSDWIGVARLVESHERRLGGLIQRDQPSVGDLVWPLEAFWSAPDVQGCIRAAATLAMRLLPLAHGPDRSGGRIDACVRLRDALMASKADGDAGRGQDASTLGSLRVLSDDAMDVVWPTRDPRRGMWTYVASLASYAAEHGAGSPDEDERLATIEF